MIPWGWVEGHQQYLQVRTYTYKVATNKIRREKESQTVVCNYLLNDSDAFHVDGGRGVPGSVHGGSSRGGMSYITDVST